MKYKKFENCLFRVDDAGDIELRQKGKWTPYKEDDNFDVKMMGMPLDEARVNEWIQSESKQPA